MLKVELVKYPLSMQIVDQLVLFMIYHQIDTIDALIAMKDEELKDMVGFKPHLIEAVHLIRGMRLN